MKPLLLYLPLAILWVAAPGALIGWIGGFFEVHLIAAIGWGLFVLFTYPRSRVRWAGRADALTYFLAFVGGCIGGLATYFAGELLH